MYNTMKIEEDFPSNEWIYKMLHEQTYKEENSMKEKILQIAEILERIFIICLLTIYHHHHTHTHTVH